MGRGAEQKDQDLDTGAAIMCLKMWARIMALTWQSTDSWLSFRDFVWRAGTVFLFSHVLSVLFIDFNALYILQHWSTDGLFTNFPASGFVQLLAE